MYNIDLNAISTKRVCFMIVPLNYDRHGRRTFVSSALTIIIQVLLLSRVIAAPHEKFELCVRYRTLIMRSMQKDDPRTVRPNDSCSPFDREWR